MEIFRKLPGVHPLVGGWRSVLLVAVLSCLITSFSLNPTTPPARTPDSSRYLDAAAELVGKGEFGDDYLLWPPLYPTLLAPGLALGLDKDFRYLNFFLLTVTTLASMLLVSLLEARPVLVVLAGVAVAFSSPMRLIFGTLWSETLILPLTLGWLFGWSRYLAYRKDSDLLLACAFFGLCLMTRHIGVVLAGTMLATLFWRNRSNSWPLFTKPLVAIGLSTIPYLLWLWRTYLISGTLTGPRPPPVLSFGILLHGLPSTLSHWLLPGIYLFDTDPWAIAASTTLLLIPFLSAIYILHSTGEMQPRTQVNRASRNELAFVSLTFIGGYVGFLYWAERSTRLEIPRDRYLAPIFVPLLILILFAATCWESKIKQRSRLSALALRTTGVAWLLAEVFLP